MKKRTLRLGSAAAVALTLFLGMAVVGAEGELTVDIASVDDSGAPLVRAVASILDPTGRPLQDLTPEDLEVSVNGETVAVADLRTAVNSDIGVAVVITVDVSGSMQGAPVEQARAAARTFVEGLAPIDSAAVVTFGDQVTPVLGFTTDRSELLGAIDGLTAVGDTALYQASGVSAFMAASVENQRRAVILLSDGLDHGGKSAISRDESIAEAQQAGVPFFTVGLGTGIDRQYLTALADATGGRFLETPSPEGLSALFSSIGDFLRSQYVVTVTAEDLDRSLPLTFELAVRSGELSGSANIRLEPREEPPAPPTVAVAGLAEGEQLEEPVVVQAQVAGGADVETVSVLVDGVEVQTFEAPPFQWEIDPRSYADGPHLLRIEVRDVRGRLAAAEVAFDAVPPAASSSGPLSWLAQAGLVAVQVALIIGAVLVYRRLRRRRQTAAQGLEQRVKPWSGSDRGNRDGGESETTEGAAWKQLEPVTIEDKPLGRIIITNGPRAGEAFVVGEHPRRIGAASYCDIVLRDDEGEVASEEARAWVRDGRLMYHRVSHFSVMALNGSPGGWLILDPGDELTVGPFRLLFELAVEETAPETPGPPTEEDAPEVPEPAPDMAAGDRPPTAA